MDNGSENDWEPEFQAPERPEGSDGPGHGRDYDNGAGPEPPGKRNGQREVEALQTRIGIPEEGISPEAEEDGEPSGDSGREEAGGFRPEPDKLLLTLLFATNDYLSARDIKGIMGVEWDLPRIRQLARTVNKTLAAQDMPFEVVEVDGTFRCRTQARYYPWVRRLFKSASPRRLSQASLETLAIIAYKQPITKAEIEAIRGVNVDGCMKSLLDKKLVDIKGKSDSAGGSFTYATTREFMRYFGLSRVPEDLPRLSDFEEIINSQALIPQIGDDGSVQEMEQSEPEA